MKKRKMRIHQHNDMVRERGVEPPRIAPLVPKTSVSTISPLARFFLELDHSLYFL